MSSPVDIERHNHALHIWINRPDKRNALNSEVVQSLIEALDTHRDSDVRVVVLGGRGKVFSAGADLKSLQQLQEASAEDNLADSRQLAQLFAEIYEYPKPVIARVHGHAIAGGCGLAAVCDVSIVSEKAKLGFTEVRIGFVPAIVSVFLQRKLGEAALRELLLRGSLISAGDAVAIGLLSRMVAPDAIDGEIDALVHEIATETSGSALAQTKSLLAALPGLGFHEALEHAIQANALARSTDDCQAGVAAFLSRDDPPWKKSAETAQHETDKKP